MSCAAVSDAATCVSRRAACTTAGRSGAMVLGADGVRSSRFVATPESSALAFKDAVVAAGEGATALNSIRTPVRLFTTTSPASSTQQRGATPMNFGPSRGRQARHVRGDLTKGNSRSAKSRP